MSVRIINADVLDGLAQLPTESVHCVVTSPPYWGLRDYGTGQWAGGSAACDHVARKARGDTERETPGGRGGSFRGGEIQFTDLCTKCGAQRIDHQLGLEPTYPLYVAAMVRAFRGVWRVLRKDGVLWLNLGDSYATGAGAVGESPGGGEQGERWRGEGSKADLRKFATNTVDPKSRHGVGPMTQPNRMPQPGLKPKDLCGIPWRVAFALQDDGWWLRQDIIWSKPNPMPESIKDRCTKAHEYLFLLTKSERYYFDAEAIAEPATGWNGSKFDDPRDLAVRPNTGRKPRPSKKRGEFNGKTEALEGREAFRAVTETRNKRSVWEIATRAFPEAHFATFPPELPETCILAGTSEHGCCSKCGAPWSRVVERTAMVMDRSERTHSRGRTRPSGHMVAPPTVVTTGWSPSCKCGVEPTPCTVLDPFGGAGTTALVADRLKRNAILLELNPEYAAMAERRIKGDCPLFTDVGAA